MSKFAYKAEGELNSQYLLELLKEYLSKLLDSNDTNGIVEDEYKINPSANRFNQWFNNKISNFKYSGNLALLENYNKVLSTKYINKINDIIDIFLQTNVLEAEQFFKLKETIKSVKLDAVIPLLVESRENAIIKSKKQYLKVLNTIKYLNKANSNYVLFNSPVVELKPFLSEKVSTHIVDYKQVQKLATQFVDLRCEELTKTDFEPYTPNFITQKEDLYKDKITDNGVGEDVEQFIRSKMIDKFEIRKREEILVEEQNEQIDKINSLLKRLKVNKIEVMMQQLVDLKTDIAKIKEVMDACKDTINSTTLENKAQIFLLMDNLLYKLQNKSETLQQKIKLKLQLVDKEKLFNMLELIQNPPVKQTKTRKKLKQDAQESDKENLDIPKRKEAIQTYKSRSIASNLYDDEEPEHIDISEDDGTIAPEDEFVIEDDEG